MFGDDLLLTFSDTGNQLPMSSLRPKTRSNPSNPLTFNALILTSVMSMTFIKNRLGSLKFGFFLPWDAAKLILKSPTLMIWSALPIALTLALYIWGFAALNDAILVWVQTKLGEFTASTSEGWLSSLLSVAGFLVNLFVKITLFFVGAITFAFVSSLVASPFNDWLAEKAEPLSSPPLPVASAGISKVKLITIDLIKTVASIIASIAALVFSIIPVLNVMTAAVWLMLVTFQYVSYPQTRRGIGLRRGLFFLWRHPYACVGFGLSVTLLFSIPFLATFALPLAVVGGTLLFAKSQEASVLR